MPTVNFGSFSKRRNSTKQPTTELSDARTVKLKESTSVDAPTFILTGNNFNYNYAAWDNRYYFIVDIRSLHNNLIEVDCVLDALASYKSDILASTQFVNYSSEQGNTWLIDTRLPVLRSTSASKISVVTGILSRIGCYIFSVVGRSSAATYMFNTDGDIKAIIDKISDWENDGISDITNLIDTTDTDSILASIGEVLANVGFVGNAYSNAPNCIRSCIWVPFDYALAPISGSDTIYLGNFNTTKTGQRISSRPVTGSTSVSIPWHFSDWRRGYCEDVYIYLPLVGLINLSADSLTQVSSINIDWSVTYSDGCISYEVKAGNEILGAYGANCSANYPIGINQQASAGEIAQAFIGGLEKTISAGINSSISPVSAGMAVAGMTAEGAIGAYNVADVSASSHPSSIGGIGGGAGIGLDINISCYTVAHNTIINPLDMQETMGLPTMKPMQLSLLSGYCQCANAHVECAAMSSELDAIDYYLNSGFFIE